MASLTPEQKLAVNRAGESPVRLADPDSDASFVLLRAEVYERILAASEGETDPREAYPTLDRIMAEDDADDPQLHLYQAGS